MALFVAVSMMLISLAMTAAVAVPKTAKAEAKEADVAYIKGSLELRDNEGTSYVRM